MMETEKVLRQAVVVFLVRGNTVCLARKAYKIGAGLWNGYGGGPESVETSEDIAVRELFEESGIVVTKGALTKIAFGLLHKTQSDGTTTDCHLDVYEVRTWKGEPEESDQMRAPTWFTLDALPLHEMMLADREWVPIALRGRRIFVEAWYGPFQKELLRPTIVRDMEKFE